MTRLTRVDHIAMGLLSLFLLATASAFAQNAATDPASESQVSEAAQKAAVDPATGRLRGITPEEARALLESVSRELSHSDEGLTLVYHPNGMISIDLEDRFQSAALVRVEPDGTLRARCVTSVEEAQQFLAGRLPVSAPAPALEEK
jgi:hypothetical protein